MITMPVCQHKVGEAQNQRKMVVGLKLEGWGRYRIGMRWRTVDEILKKRITCKIALQR